MKRNASIDVLKFVFAVFIAIGHFSREIISSGLIVNLFFVLSGFFLVSSFDSGKYDNSWKYTFSRVKRIYPYYLVAFVFLFAWNNLKSSVYLYEIPKAFLKSLPEIFLLQNIGVFPGGINYPLWQLSTLIVGSHIMFSLLKWNKQMTTNVICPIIAIGVYTYFSNAYDAGAPDYWGVECQFMYIPLIRAVGNIAIGVFVNYPIKKCVKYLEDRANRSLSLIISGLGIFSILVFWLNRESDASIIPFLFMLISMLYSRSIYAKVFKSNRFGCLDKLSLAFYLNHALIIYVYNELSTLFPRIFVQNSEVCYILLLMVYSILMLKLVDYIITILKKIMFFLQC